MRESPVYDWIVTVIALIEDQATQLSCLALGWHPFNRPRRLADPRAPGLGTGRPKADGTAGEVNRDDS